MRIAAGLGASAVVLIVAGAIGLLAPWALGTGAVLSLLAAVVATTALESRDLIVPLDKPMPPSSALHGPG